MSRNSLPGTPIYPPDIPVMDLSVELTNIRDLINSTTVLDKRTRDELSKRISDTRRAANQPQSRHANQKKFKQWNKLLKAESTALEEANFNATAVEHLIDLLVQIQAEAQQAK
jgi:hypothetical protein